MLYHTSSLIDCGLFHDLPHGDVDITNTTNGLIATLTCHFGYILNGSNTTECASNGEWNHTGQNCVPVGKAKIHLST
ncbi:hypothetical protein DPMN_107806 [Dreissena polymorpha]|uniref:Sushi domain-containing protein n=1 Tax=Dreissena polymorpha TaxID=45954 RepID=A0A9D4QK82_DREPO|nr:hypothetical protein DPMN_107806 [Dreissena polymorpha]